MPTYEYACKACDHNFEIVQSFSEDSLTTCPECEQDELRKVYNAAGIIFKGDGWHIKDYASSGGSSGAASGGDSASSTSDSDSSSAPVAKDTKDAKGARKKKSGSAGSSAAAAKPAAS